MELYFTPDYEIPVRYTTRSGRQIECNAAIRVESETEAEIEQLRTWIKEHDWSEFGQTVFEYAIEHPVKAHPEDVDDADEQLLQAATWSQALQRVLMDALPRHLMPDGFRMHASGTCDGAL